MELKPIRKDLWARIETALKILAEGVCLRAEVEDRMGVYGGSAARLFDAMIRERFITQQVIPLIGWNRFAVVELTEGGAMIAERFLGYPVQKSEWQILTEKHNAGEYSKHALTILVFAFHARKRGWRVEVCPTVDNPLAKPDILVEKDGERVYVEVEVLRHPRKRRDGADNTWVRKWRNQRDFQKRVAVCTLTPKRRAGIVAYLRPRMPGMATDLATLARRPDSDLWVERWNWPNEFSMRGYV